MEDFACEMAVLRYYVAKNDPAATEARRAEALAAFEAAFPEYYARFSETPYDKDYDARPDSRACEMAALRCHAAWKKDGRASDEYARTFARLCDEFGLYVQSIIQRELRDRLGGLSQ